MWSGAFDACHCQEANLFYMLDEDDTEIGSNEVDKLVEVVENEERETSDTLNEKNSEEAVSQKYVAPHHREGYQPDIGGKWNDGFSKKKKSMKL
jgi:hypothetical protein